MKTTYTKKFIKAFAVILIVLTAFSGSFAYAQTSETYSISGIKFHDVNKNGIKEYSEAFMYNWVITISGDKSATTRTVLGGTYEFQGLLPGSYTVCEGEQEGWKQHYPGGDGCHYIEISNEDVSEINFGNYMVPITSPAQEDTQDNSSADNSNTGNNSNNQDNESNGDVLGDNAAPNIRLTKTGDRAFLNQGGQITYTVTAVNTGEASVVNLVLTDTLPNGFTLVGDGSNSISWTIAELEAGEVWSETFPVNVSGSIPLGNYANIVRGTADNYEGELFASHSVEVREGAVLGKTGASPIALAVGVSFATVLGIIGVEIFRKKNLFKAI